MTSTSARGSTSITLQFSLERSLDAAAQDVQSAIAASLRRLPPGMPNPPTFRKVNPADQPILILVAQLADPAALGGGRVRRDHDRAAHFHDQRRGPGQRDGRAEVRRARAAGPQPAGRARHRHRRSAERAGAQQRQPAHRHAVGPAPGLHGAGHRTADERRRLPPADRGLPQRPPGAPGGTRPGDRQRGERQGRRAGSTTRAPSRCWCSASPAPTRWKWWTASRSCCPASASRCRLRSNWTSSTTAPSRSANRSTT